LLFDEFYAAVNIGIRIVTFEACSGFTRVTARRIAQPPKVTFVTRLQSRQLPSETARQLPDLSTIIRVEPSSTSDSRLQGALPIADILQPNCSGYGLPRNYGEGHRVSENIRGVDAALAHPR